MRKREESGFALLLVFLMAAAIGITLYMEVPRVAFESQRDREQMAIDHAMQYKRAIQLYYRKYQLYPQSLDDLETTKNIRFLRRRYLDPLTGKEFRLLHVGPSGQLIDSLVTPLAAPNGPGGTTGSASPFGSSSTQTTNATPPSAPDPNNPPPPDAPDPLNMATRRTGDRTPGQSGPGQFTNDPGDQPQPEEPDPNQPQPGQPGFAGQPGIPGQPGVPGQQPAFPQFPVPTDPDEPAEPQAPAVPTGVAPGPSPTAPTAPASPFPQNPNVNGPQSAQTAQPGLPGSQPNGAGARTAASLIQGLLTTPRQPPSSITSPFTSGNTGGIAGVASTAEGKGIHEVNDHSKYKEWEFVYDLKKDKTVVGAAGAAAQQQGQQGQQPGANNPFGSSPFSNSTSGPTSGSTSGSSATPTSPSPSSSGPTTPPPAQ